MFETSVNNRGMVLWVVNGLCVAVYVLRFCSGCVKQSPLHSSVVWASIIPGLDCEFVVACSLVAVCWTRLDGKRGVRVALSIDRVNVFSGWHIWCANIMLVYRFVEHASIAAKQQGSARIARAC